ncbi:MAG TPA: hypothetical protein VLG08_04515 [Casimicrobiaceae bacterium]|jgi:hypothetical protein|nr:hypothetical protein [Casimicrobiaceae bacterium]
MSRADGLRGAGTNARTRRILALLAAVAIAPVVLAYVAYYAWPRDARLNYGELLSGALPAIHGTRLDGTPFASDALRGRWVVLHEAPGDCAGDCRPALYASRQARTIQNAERERVVRVWLLAGNGAPPSSLLAEHPDLAVVRVDAPPSLPRGSARIYLIDPLGNFVLAWPSKPDIKAMAKDLGRVLRASSIG